MTSAFLHCGCSVRFACPDALVRLITLKRFHQTPGHFCLEKPRCESICFLVEVENYIANVPFRQSWLFHMVISHAWFISRTRCCLPVNIITFSQPCLAVEYIRMTSLPFNTFSQGSFILLHANRGTGFVMLQQQHGPQRRKKYSPERSRAARQGKVPEARQRP